MRTFYNQGAAERRPRCECDSPPSPLSPSPLPLPPLPCPPHPPLQSPSPSTPRGPSTHWLASLEPAPLGEGPPGQDDAGQ